MRLRSLAVRPLFAALAAFAGLQAPAFADGMKPRKVETPAPLTPQPKAAVPTPTTTTRTYTHPVHPAPAPVTRTVTTVMHPPTYTTTYVQPVYTTVYTAPVYTSQIISQTVVPVSHCAPSVVYVPAGTLSIPLDGGVGAGLDGGYYGGGGGVIISGGGQAFSGVLSAPASAFTFQRKVTKPAHKPMGTPCCGKH